jgi:acyl-CoA thioester hydrolase
MIPVDKIQALPLAQRTTITDAHLDAMNHMNVRWYMAIFDDATWSFFHTLGMTLDYYRQNEAGGFALQHDIRYLAEIRVGETVAVHMRVLGRSAKRIHTMYFMVNETTGKLAATLESLGSHADLRRRRTSPYPPEIAARIDAMLTEHCALDWEAPVSGMIAP